MHGLESPSTSSGQAFERLGYARSLLLHQSFDTLSQDHLHKTQTDASDHWPIYIDFELKEEKEKIQKEE